MKYLLMLAALSGCAASSSYNIIDLTDDQWIEDKDGNVCLDKEMIIDKDRLIYLYPKCGIRRVVKGRPHILPTPKAK